MRGDLIETFKIINVSVDHGHDMFGTNTAYRTRNLNVTSHNLLTSALDFFAIELLYIGTDRHYACKI